MATHEQLYAELILINCLSFYYYEERSLCDIYFFLKQLGRLLNKPSIQEV